MVGDKVVVKKSIGNIKVGTEVKILDIKCNDRQRLLESDLSENHIEVCKNAFQYKIDKDTWTTYDRLDIKVKPYKPKLSNCILEVILVVMLITICIAFAVIKSIFNIPNKIGLVPIISGYLAVATIMNLYDAKLKTRGTELKIVRNGK